MKGWAKYHNDICKFSVFFTKSGPSAHFLWKKPFFIMIFCSSVFERKNIFEIKTAVHLVCEFGTCLSFDFKYIWKSHFRIHAKMTTAKSLWAFFIYIPFSICWSLLDNLFPLGSSQNSKIFLVSIFILTLTLLVVYVRTNAHCRTRYNT